MPEVVYATPDANGKPRNWNDVFTIWNLNVENSEWRVIDNIMDIVAMNNRMGSRTSDELREHLLKEAAKNITSLLTETEEKLAALPNPSLDEIREKRDEVITEEHKKILKDRNDLWAHYGKYVFYINAVFDNLGGAYREYKA